MPEVNKLKKNAGVSSYQTDAVNPVQQDYFLIAPCGMNCSLCFAFLREKNKCPGCRGNDKGKPVTRINCKIKNCNVLRNDENEFCFSCNKYPCGQITRLDNRYTTKYNMSMIENLDQINKSGMKKFLSMEKKKCRCSICGGTICVHTGSCSVCRS